MYYAEKMIDGKWWYKLTPSGKWNEFSKDMYRKKTIELEILRLKLVEEINK